MAPCPLVGYTEDGGFDITVPVFYGVTIKNSTEEQRTISQAEGNVKFIGYYDAFGITAADDDIFYMTADNTLKHTGQPRTLKSCRAYFQFTGEASTARSFTLNFGDDVTTAISQVENEVKGNDAIYDLQGRRVVNTNKKGLFIQNGNKVVIK